MSTQPFNTALHPRTGDGTFTATAHSDAVPSLVGVKIGEPRELTREELVITGQGAPGNPAMSEVTRMMAHRRKDIAKAIRAMDGTLMDAAVIQAKQISPGAKEIRLRSNQTWPERKETSSLTTKEGDVLRDDGSPDSWAFAEIEGSDPSGICSAISGISAHSDIWDTDTRCDYDPQTEEHIIYLDGRRRQEH